MALPTPERGLVISYAYLWHSEHEQGREEGIKDRPCVIVLAVRKEGGKQVVMVAPVTHSAPSNAEEAVEIPPATKRRLGLDEARSWVMVNQANRFTWPGPDVRPLPNNSSRFEYGILPPGLFNQVRKQISAYVAIGRLKLVPRTE